MRSTSGVPHAAGFPEPVLSLNERVGEVIFGLIMALTFTGSLSVASERSEVREMLIGALGCNIAWGLVDGVMYLLGLLADRGRGLKIFREVRTASDPGQARQLIRDALPPVIASSMEPADLDQIRSRLGRMTEPAGSGLALRDFRAAIGIFLLVFLSTLPVALPFAIFHEPPHRAIRISNGIALAMLFVGGYVIGKHSGRRPWLSGLVMLALGAVLVWATILLGG